MKKTTKSTKKTVKEKPKEKKVIVKPKKEVVKKNISPLDTLKLFGRWDSNIEVRDLGLKKYLGLKARIIPRSGGRYQRKQFYKSKMHIVERLVLKMMVAGHSGKKHKISSGRNTESFLKNLSTVEKSFEIIEKKTKKNPIEVFVRALENAAIREETTSFQVGGIIARKAVITSPQRRIDKALRYIVQGTYQKCYGKKSNVADVLANEIIAAYNNSPDSLAIREKERIEREAASAR